MEAGQLRGKPPHELALGVGSPVGERALRNLPNPFVRVEFGGVAWKAKEVEPGKGALKHADRLSPMDRAVVPDQHHRSAQMSKQVTEEVADLRMLDVLGVQPEVKTQAPPTRTDREARDHRDAISALTMANERGVTARGPSPLNTWDQEEARFVDEDEVGTQPRGFFFMRGHASFFQRSIRSSSRSSARRSGFCTLHPKPWRRRPTWSR